MSTAENNLFVKYIRDVLPVEMSVKSPDVAGKVAEMIFLSEFEGNPALANDNFETIRDRAALCMPYQVPRDNLGKREHALDILELCFTQHRQLKHKENHEERILKLTEGPKTEFESQLVAVTTDFWNG